MRCARRDRSCRLRRAGIDDRSGHHIRAGSYTLFGSAQAILLHPDTGLYRGDSDSRRDRAALSWGGTTWTQGSQLIGFR